MGRRILAFWVDSMISALCFLPVWIQGIGSFLEEGAFSIEWRWVAVGLLLQLFYKWLFLYFLSGTLGKLFFGLRVIPTTRPAEEGLGLFQSFLRVFTDSLSFFFGQSLRALALVRLDRTHVSDWVAETRVVQLAPRRNPPKRHWVLAVLIILVSFFSQFQNIYQLTHRTSFVEGRFVFDAGR